MYPARRTALLALAALGATVLSTGPARADEARLTHEIDLGQDSQYAPSVITQMASDGQYAGFLEQRSPGDVLIHGGGNLDQVYGATAGLSVVGSVVYLPSAPGGGTTPTQVQLRDQGSITTVALNAGERYLGGAGDDQVLLATTVPAGTALTLRSTGPTDTLVTTLPAGTIGDVVSDATTALLAFTPDGASVPVIDAITLANGNVTQVNTTPLTIANPLVALSGGTFAWSDTTEVVRVPRTGGAELRRTSGAVTALAVHDDSTGWNSGGHLYTAVLDPGTDAIDHGAVLNGTLLEALGSTGYATAADHADYSSLDSFSTTQAASTQSNYIGHLDAVVTDLQLQAGEVFEIENSGVGGAGYTVQSDGIHAGGARPQFFGGATAGRRLVAVSGRFTAVGASDDKSVKVTTTLPDSSIAPGPDLTVPISPGVDTIQLSGMRLLVHRPGASKSQLYTLGSSTPVDYPLVSAIFGPRIAWLDSDGSIHSTNLASGTTTTVRAADTTACIGGESLANTLIRVAGDEVFWSLCGENRVHRLAAGTDLLLPSGDLAAARLGTGALATVDAATHTLSITDVDTGTSYPVADAPRAFDIDDRVVAWTDSNYATHLAPLPFDNSDVVPQLLAEWGDTGVAPADYTPNHTLSFWHHDADFTQPVTGDLAIPSLGYVSSGTTPGTYPYLPGSINSYYDGQDYRTSDEPPAKTGLYAFTLTATPASGQGTQLSGSLIVRDVRQGRVVVTSAPKTLVAGARGLINMKALIGSAAVQATIGVQARAHGTTTWKTVRTLSTASTGALSFAITPTTNSDYQFVFVSGAYGPVSTTSQVVTVSVAQKITAALSAATVRTGTSVTLSGGVSPAKPGQIEQVQKYASGAWHTIANVKLSSASGYRLWLKAVRGSVSYRVVRAADKSNAAGTSNTVVLKGT